MTQNPDNSPLLPNSSSKITPQLLAAGIVAWVKAAIKVIASLILLIVALGTGYVVIRGMLVAIKMVLQALGI